MSKSRIPALQERNAEKLLNLLVEHWQHRYRPQEVHDKVKALLQALKKTLARDSADARFVVATYRRMQQHLALEQEVELANQVLKRMVAEMSAAVVSLVPFNLIDLPAMYSLAHHFHIDLLPAATGHQKPAADTSGTSSS